MRGWLDEVAIFNTFLSDADIKAIYNNGKGMSLLDRPWVRSGLWPR